LNKRSDTNQSNYEITDEMMRSIVEAKDKVALGMNTPNKRTTSTLTCLPIVKEETAGKRQKRLKQLHHLNTLKE